jgi:hypothetical protein
MRDHSAEVSQDRQASEDRNEGWDPIGGLGLEECHQEGSLKMSFLANGSGAGGPLGETSSYPSG